MTIFLKNKHTLQVGEFRFKCCIGKNGLSKKKKEGDKKTPVGIFKIGNLYYRKDKISLPKTKGVFTELFSKYFLKETL